MQVSPSGMAAASQAVPGEFDSRHLLQKIDKFRQEACRFLFKPKGVVCNHGLPCMELPPKAYVIFDLITYNSNGLLPYRFADSPDKILRHFSENRLCSLVRSVGR